MIKRIGIVVVLTFICCVAAGNPIAEGQTQASDDDVSPYSSIAPPFLTPRKSVFATREGDQFVVAVTATCLLEDDDEAQFELLASSPGFIHVSDVYRKEYKANGYAEGMALVYFNPQIGDAGKYVVSLKVKACGGRVDRIITFTVKVKPAQMD